MGSGAVAVIKEDPTRTDVTSWRGCNWLARCLSASVCAAIVCIGFCSVLADAALAAHGSDRVRFRTMAESAGLPQSSVSALVQDQLGFIWLGTQDGLARFDGEEVRVLKHDRADLNSLSSSYVQALAMAPEQQLWVASPALGLSRLDLRTMQIKRYRAEQMDSGLVDDVIVDLKTDRQGRLWVSTRTAGVKLYDPATDRFLPPPFNLPWQGRQRVLADTQHRGLIIAVDDQVWGWQDEREPRLLFDGADAAQGAFSAVEDGLDRLWVGTRSGGLYGLDADAEVVEHFSRADGHGLVNDAIARLLVDATGRLWIGTGAGLCMRNSRAADRLICWTHHPGDPNGLPGNDITALMEDRDGLLWTGTWTGGAAIHSPKDEAFVLSHAEPEDPMALPTQAVGAMAEATEGGLWLALMDGGGLVRFKIDGGVQERYPQLDQFLPWSVYTEDEVLWVGTVYRGLLRRDRPGAEFTAVELGADGIETPGVQSIYRDRDGTLWATYLSDGMGALCADCDEFRHYQHGAIDPNQSSGANINQVLQTSDGQHWLAVNSGGLHRFDPSTGKVDRFLLNTLEGETVFTASCLFEDRAGRLWVGSQGHGLLLAKRDASGAVVEFETVDRRHGLPADAIGGILEDDAGWLWVSTTAGLAKVNPDRLSAVSWRPYSRLRAPDYFVGSSLSSSNGHFHFGGAHGMTSFNPAEVQLQRVPPGISVAGLFLTNLPALARADASSPGLDVGHADSIWLHDGQELVSLELAADRPLAARELRFAYRLDPLHEDWLELPPSRRQVTLARLAAGEYSLRLKARLSGRDEWGEERQLTLIVAPPAWASPLAILLYLLLASAIALPVLLLLRRLWLERLEADRALALSEELLKQSLWGSRGELWDADVSTGLVRRENQIPHLKLDQVSAGNTLAIMRPFVHDDDRDAFNRSFGEVFTGNNEYFEVSYRTLDDKDAWRWMLTRGKIVERGADNRPLRVVGTTFDISDVRAQEDALRESQDRLRMSLWGSRDELWDLDVGTNQLHRENPLPALALAVDMRFDRADEYLEFIHPQDREVFQSAIGEHISGDSDDFEVTYRMLDRQERWIWILSRGRAVSRDADGRAARIVGTNRDITTLKGTEAELKLLNEELEERVSVRTAELESAVADLSATLEQLTQAQNQLIDAEKMAALGNLVAGVAHDINTPLGIGVTAASHLRGEIQSMSEHLKRGELTRSELTGFIDRGMRGAELILGNLSRASDLVRSFKQVAVDQSSEQRREIELDTYLAEVLQSLQPTLARSPVGVSLECPPGVIVDTFPGAIYQIVVNLVLNAITHAFVAEQAGTIAVSARHLGADVQIQVRDDGKGMEEGIRKRIFEPFFTTRRGQGGSGLGLHIVYNLAHELLGGTVHCSSQLGAGTTFILQFPRCVDVGTANNE